MKIQAHDNSLETNAEVESQDFGIGDASVVIEILRNRLYEHKIRTLVQEYMCNGRDAQREVKSSKRLIISVPNAISPVFKVRDFGPGISPDRMKNVFVMYGSSTKRGTNGQTGGFGIGAKSAWSYTDSFTIISITNGKKRTYVAHTGVNNQGRLDLISTVDTSEENGTEIQVAVKPFDCTEFKESIFRASYFWTETERPEFRGITILDVPKYEQGLKIGELEIPNKQLPNYIGLNGWGESCALIIDGIPYPVANKLIFDLQHLKTLLGQINGKAIIHVGNGIVEVSASRESIADSEITRTNLGKLAFKCYQDLVSHVRKEFKAVKCNADWIKTYHSLSKSVHVDDHAAYGDYSIERNTIGSKLFSKVTVVHATNTYGRRRKKTTNIRHQEAKWIPISEMDQVFFSDPSDSKVNENRRIREYLEKTGKTSIVLLGTKVVAPQKDMMGITIPGTEITLKDSQATLTKIVKDFDGKILSSLPFTPVLRVPKAKRDRTKEMFTMHICNGYGKSPHTTTMASIVADKRKYLYIKFSEYEKFEAEFRDVAGYIRNSTTLTICALTDSSIEMVKSCTNFSNYSDWKKNFKADASLIKQIRSVKAKNKKAIKLLERADEKIKDKHIVNMITEYKGLTFDDHIPETIFKMVYKDVESFLADDKVLTELFAIKYPLINVVIDCYDWKIKVKEANELVTYINAKQ